MKFTIHFSTPRKNNTLGYYEITVTLRQVNSDGTRRSVLWADIPLGVAVSPEDAEKFRVAYAQDLKDLAKAAIQAAEIE